MLYIVSTPIGNLKDITLRALEVLKEVDVIICEDTRRTKILLNHYNIKKQLISFFEYNKNRRLPLIINLLTKGKKCALVSDAGLPCISDPGFTIVRDCIKKNIPVTVIPGPEAVLSSLVVSGLPTSKFVFLGFLTHKAKRRKRLLESYLSTFSEFTVIFFESCHRLIKTLSFLKEIDSQREVVVIKELTKLYECVFRGNPQEVINKILENSQVKGEFVILIGPKNYRI